MIPIIGSIFSKRSAHNDVSASKLSRSVGLEQLSQAVNTSVRRGVPLTTKKLNDETQRYLGAIDSLNCKMNNAFSARFGISLDDYLSQHKALKDAQEGMQKARRYGYISDDKAKVCVENAIARLFMISDNEKEKQELYQEVCQNDQDTLPAGTANAVYGAIFDEFSMASTNMDDRFDSTLAQLYEVVCSDVAENQKIDTCLGLLESLNWTIDNNGFPSSEATEMRIYRAIYESYVDVKGCLEDNGLLIIADNIHSSSDLSPGDKVSLYETLLQNHQKEVSKIGDINIANKLKHIRDIAANSTVNEKGKALTEFKKSPELVKLTLNGKQPLSDIKSSLTDIAKGKIHRFLAKHVARNMIKTSNIEKSKITADQLKRTISSYLADNVKVHSSVDKAKVHSLDDNAKVHSLVNELQYTISSRPAAQAKVQSTESAVGRDESLDLYDKFDELAKRTKEQETSLVYLPYLSTRDRYINIKSALASVVPSAKDGEEPYPINELTVDGVKIFNATHFPTAAGMSTYLSNICKLGGPIIVLANDKDMETAKKPAPDYFRGNNCTDDYRIEVVADSNSSFDIGGGTGMPYPVSTWKINITDSYGQSHEKDVWHVNSWPDYGVLPPDTLLKLTDNFLTKYPEAEKAVVHCIAGVGRTGTFAASVAMLKLKKENKEIDPDDIILKLRAARSPNMVQNDTQYEVVLKMANLVQDKAFHSSYIGM